MPTLTDRLLRLTGHATDIIESGNTRAGLHMHLWSNQFVRIHCFPNAAITGTCAPKIDLLLKCVCPINSSGVGFALEFLHSLCDSIFLLVCDETLKHSQCAAWKPLVKIHSLGVAFTDINFICFNSLLWLYIALFWSLWYKSLPWQIAWELMVSLTWSKAK